ncbi:GntR family transcriptional regulator [Streptomyces sp. NPDC004100]
MRGGPLTLGGTLGGSAVNIQNILCAGKGDLELRSGEARPGDFLRTERVAEAVGVSSTPVREGLLALRSEGFVQPVPRRGFVVAPFTRQDVRDLFWTQAQLSGELAARAARRITARQTARSTPCCWTPCAGTSRSRRRR